MTAPYHFREFTLRAELVESLERYVQHGVPVGDFLRAAICNDFMEVCGRADDDNQRNLPALAAYLYNEMPMSRRGAENYAAWVKECAGGSPPRFLDGETEESSS
jgi:hypothetical protein